LDAKKEGGKKRILASHPFSKTPKSIDSGKTKSQKEKLVKTKQIKKP
jgi:hypothetical protein